MKKIIAVVAALVLSVGLFLYLYATPLMWRIIFSSFLFLSLYVFIDGFINYEG
jgi:hypothetical protein